MGLDCFSWYGHERLYFQRNGRALNSTGYQEIMEKKASAYGESIDDFFPAR